MIRLYRFIRDPNETMLTFQGDESDVRSLTEILGCRILPSKLDRFCEGGYYSTSRYWRDPIALEAQASRYLAGHYRPPTVLFPRFAANTPPPADLPGADWSQIIAKEICLVVGTAGTEPGYGGFQQTFPWGRQVLGEGISGERGLKFRVIVNAIDVPVLEIDVIHRFFLEGEQVSEQELYSVFGGKPIAAAVKEFSTLQTNEIFERCIEFVDRLPALESAGGCKFIPEPMDANRLGLDTWLWAHDSPVELVGGGGAVIPLPNRIEKWGVFQPPAAPLVVFVVHPTDAVGARRGNNGVWLVHEIERIVRTLLRTDVIVYPVPYTCGGDEREDEVILNECCNLGAAFPGCVELALMIAAPDRRPYKERALRDAAEERSRRLFKGLRAGRRRRFVSTMGWDGLDVDGGTSAVESAILKGLVALGAVPWLLGTMPVADGETVEDLCFIGIDLKIQRRHAVAAGVVLDGRGVLHGYHAIRLREARGDILDPETAASLVRSLVEHYRQALGRDPRHVIIHRDGIAGDEFVGITAVIPAGARLDVIEIRKSGGPRIGQIGNACSTPSRDIAVGSEASGEAFLVNDLVMKERLRSGAGVFPAPTTIAVKRVLGSTHLRVLAGQVHALTFAHFGCYRSTTRVPATIQFADDLAANVSFHQDQVEVGCALVDGERAYWI